MAEQLSRHEQMIQDCEAAIARIRAEIREGRGNGDDVGAEWEFIQNAVQPRFVRYARQLRWMGDQVFEEALLAMNDRLFDHIWSLTYHSLETALGRYLHHMPWRVLQETARKHSPDGVSQLIEHLDEVVGEDGVQRHELVEDHRAEAAFGTLADRQDLGEAIERLPSPEKDVVLMRLREIDNNTIARHLTVAPATATRIWKRAVEMLKQQLDVSEE